MGNDKFSLSSSFFFSPFYCKESELHGFWKFWIIKTDFFSFSCIFCSTKQTPYGLNYFSCIFCTTKQTSYQPHEDTPFSARPNDTIYMIKSNPMKIFLFLHFLHIQTDPKYRLKPTPWRYFFSYVFLPNQTDPICIQSNPMKLFPFAFPLLMNNNEDITSSSREMEKFTAKTSGLLCFYKFPCFHGAKPVYICFFIFISGYIFGSYRRATTLTLKSIKYMVL